MHQRPKRFFSPRQQMSRTHQLDSYRTKLVTDGKQLEQLSSVKLLGTHVQCNLKWTDHINATISSCYSTLAALRKLKHLAPFLLKKQLGRASSWRDLTTTMLFVPVFKQKSSTTSACDSRFRAQSLRQRNRYSRSLGWLPITERRDFHLLKLAHKALYSSNWPA